jgi:hypothetical protein
MNPELLPLSEFVAQKSFILEHAGIENVRSLQAQSNIEAEHLLAVRAAVFNQRPIHADNRIEYKKQIPGLAHYSTNGNVAVYDTRMKPLTPKEQRQQFVDRIATFPALKLDKKMYRYA